VLGSAKQVDEFLAAVFAAEEPALTDNCNFTEALASVLSRWRCPGTIGDALDAWTMIEVDPDIANTVRLLRLRGIGCHLATNQERYRARHMSVTLGYSELFDREFYSCRLGVMKPDVSYFRAILRELGAEPRDVLFIDDHETNIEGAREVGLHVAEFRIDAGADACHRLLGKFGIGVA